MCHFLKLWSVIKPILKSQIKNYKIVHNFVYDRRANIGARCHVKNPDTWLRRLHKNQAPGPPGGPLGGPALFYVLNMTLMDKIVGIFCCLSS